MSLIEFFYNNLDSLICYFCSLMISTFLIFYTTYLKQTNTQTETNTHKHTNIFKNTNTQRHTNTNILMHFQNPHNIHNPLTSTQHHTHIISRSSNHHHTFIRSWAFNDFLTSWTLVIISKYWNKLDYCLFIFNY